MIEYGSVSAPSYDLDGFVAHLNAKSADGWDVVSVATAGADLVGILRREATVASFTAAVETPSESVSSMLSSVVSDPVSSYIPSEPISASVPTISVPEPVVITPEPMPVTITPEPISYQPSVNEPAGWATAPEPAPAQAPAPVVQAAPVVTTPAGWYPDPSSRFEMRYWDGNAWTEHVSRQGQQYTDPPVA